MPEHSPTPYRVIRGTTRKGDYIRIAAANHVAIAEILQSDADHDHRATAEFIVRACNALEGLLTSLEYLMERIQDESGDLPTKWPEFRQASAALRLAKTTNEPASAYPWHTLRVVLQEELSALRTWREAKPLHTDVQEGIEISISKIESALRE